MATDFSLPVFVITDITISAVPYKLPVFQTGKTVKVRLVAAPNTEYTGVEDGATGIYKFTGVEDGKYHKLVNGVQSGTFGVTNGRYIADDTLPYAKLTGGNVFTGIQDLETAFVDEAFIDLTSVPYSTNTPSQLNSLVWKNWVQTMFAKLAGGNTFTGNQVIAGSLNLTGQVLALLDIIAREMFIDASSVPYTTNTPSFNTSLVWKSWVESRIASIIVTPFQESSNLVVCIPNGTQETNKVYRTLKLCSNSFASPSITDQCAVLVKGMGSASQYIEMSLNTLRSYVHMLGMGKHCKIIMSDGATNTKTMNWERLTIIFGGNDYATAREYSGMTFEDCDIYAYKDTTFNNCTLLRCNIYHASTFKAFLKGTTSARYCGFLNDPDKTQLSDQATVVGSHKIYLPGGMPADPSSATPPPEE